MVWYVNGEICTVLVEEYCLIESGREKLLTNIGHDLSNQQIVNDSQDFSMDFNL